MRGGYTTVSTVTGMWVATALPSLGALAAERDCNPTYPLVSVMDTLCLLVQAYRDAAACLLLRVTTYRDAGARLHLQGRAYRDAAGRLLLGITAYRDAASRLRFQRPSFLQATPYRQDTFTRADQTGGWGTTSTGRPLSVL